MVFGIPKRGFGMLNKSKKPKISEQLKVLLPLKPQMQLEKLI